MVIEGRNCSVIEVRNCSVIEGMRLSRYKDVRLLRYLVRLSREETVQLSREISHDNRRSGVDSELRRNGLYMIESGVQFYRTHVFANNKRNYK